MNMLGHSSIFTLLALFCLGEADDSDVSKTLQEIYLNKCNKSYPGNQELYDNSYYWLENRMCWYVCSGIDSGGRYFHEKRNKEDGLKCSVNKWTKEESHCLSGSCVLTSSIDACKRYIEGVVTAVEGKECNLTCHGEGEQTVQVQKPEGNNCVIQDVPWKPAKCTSYGYCEGEKNFMKNLEGGVPVGLSTNDLIARDQCEERHNKNVAVFRTNQQDDCEFICHYNVSSEVDFEIFDFPDDYACGNGWACFGGRCRNQSSIEDCKHTIGESLLDIDVKECELNCLGKDSYKKKYLPAGTPCSRMKYGWPSEVGLCSESGQCVIEAAV